MDIAFFRFWITGLGRSSQDGISWLKGIALWPPLSLATGGTTNSLRRSAPQTQCLSSVFTNTCYVFSGTVSPTPRTSPLIAGFPAMFKVLKLTPASLSLISAFLPPLPEPRSSSSSLLRKELSSFFYLCSPPQTHVVQLVFTVQISTALCSNHFTRTGFILLSFKIFSYLGL